MKGCNVEDYWVAFKKNNINIRDKYIPKNTVSFNAKWAIKEDTKCHR